MTDHASGTPPTEIPIKETTNPMFRSKFVRVLGVVLSLALFTAACGGDDAEDAVDNATDTTEATDEGTEEAAANSAEICTTDELVEAVEGGPDEGTLAGMTDDPVGTAASNNPVLTTLVQAVSAAGLVDTLNNAEALTVFAPTDCAFAKLDEATLNAALADPKGLLTQVLGFHVIAGEQLESGDFKNGELEAFTGAKLPIKVEGDTVTVGGGQAKVLVPNIKTANATVHLIDTVMIPPSS